MFMSLLLKVIVLTTFRKYLRMQFQHTEHSQFQSQHLRIIHKQLFVGEAYKGLL